MPEKHRKVAVKEEGEERKFVKAEDADYVPIANDMMMEFQRGLLIVAIRHLRL